MKASQYRESAFCILFESSFRDDSPEELFAIAEEIGEIPVSDKCRALVKGVLSEAGALDQIIASYSPRRALNRIARVDLIILRIAIYELRSSKKLPAGVIVSEAVHLSEIYASAEDTSFINGILGNYVRQHQE